MQIGVIGLGRMGGNISRRLMKAGHRCVVFDVNAKPREALAKEGATAVGSLEDMVKALKETPRAVWVMLPAGKITEETVEHLGGLLKPNDIIIDGGNSFYKDDIRRAKKLAEKSIRYVDCGTSGGVWGIERGYCMMIGGPKEAVDYLDPIFAALAPGPGDIPRTPGHEKGDSRAERGYIHAGPAGAGHFVKMVHNGIEYGLMQAYAEGFDILRNKDSKDIPEDERFVLNMPDIAEVWRRGSVISSWLLDLGAAALAKDPQLKDFSGFVQDSGEGRWTIEAAIEEAVPADVLTTALYARDPKSQRNFTDPESLIMKSKDGFVQAYNAQAAVDAGAQIIVAHQLTQCGNDQGQLVRLIEAIENNLDRKPEQASADSGYCSESNLEALEAHGIDGYVAPGRAKHPIAANGKIGGPLTQRMRKKIDDGGFETPYRLRKQVVEPVFGQIKQARGFRQFLLRGVEKVRAEWAMICTTHNLLKLFTLAKPARAG